MSDVPLPLTIEELEEGASLLRRGDVDCLAFWHENGSAFRRTLLVALRETSDALTREDVPLAWRAELESQLELLWRSAGTHFGGLGSA